MIGQWHWTAWLACGVIVAIGLACHWADARMAKNAVLTRKAGEGTA